MLLGALWLGVIGIIVAGTQLAESTESSYEENDLSAPTETQQLPSGILTGRLPDPSIFKPLTPGLTGGAVDDEWEGSHVPEKSSSSSSSSPSSSSSSSSSSSFSSSSSAYSSSESAGDDKEVSIEELPEPDLGVSVPSGQLPKLPTVGVPSPISEAAVLSASASAAATSQQAQPVFTENLNVRRKRQDEGDGGGDAGGGEAGGSDAGGGDAGGGDGAGGEDGAKKEEGGDTEPADNGGTGDADGGGKTDGNGDDKKTQDDQDGDAKDKKDGKDGQNAKAGKGGKGKKGDDEEDGGDNEAASGKDGQSETGDGEDEDGESGSDKSGKGGDKRDDDASADSNGGDTKMGRGKGSHGKGANIRRCQSKTGQLLPTATKCHDTLSERECKEFEKRPGDSFRNPICNLKSVYDKAVKCARTCSICCIRGAGSHYSPGGACVDDPNYHNCRRELCHDPVKGASVKAHCRKTCNLCHSRNNCKDTWVGCEPYKKVCSKPALKSWLDRNCAGTCEICGKDDGSQRAKYNCQNRASNCRSLITLCEDHQWFYLMTRNCARTCGRCDVLKRGGHRDCYDEKAHSCTKWNDPQWPGNNGVPFCNNPAYREDTRRRYCKKTCGYCF